MRLYFISHGFVLYFTCTIMHVSRDMKISRREHRKRKLKTVTCKPYPQLGKCGEPENKIYPAGNRPNIENVGKSEIIYFLSELVSVWNTLGNDRRVLDYERL